MRIVAAVLFAVVLAQPALAERRLALVVGNDSYDEVTGLRKAVNDAHAMADALKPLGFEVEIVDNASRSAMSRRLVDFERRLQPGDTALFYFAGHGVEIRGENYLLPTDVPNAGEGEEGLVRDTAFAARDIITRIQSRGAGRVIAILDACRNNPFEPSLGSRALGDGSTGLAGMEAPEGVFVLMSAGASQEALDTLGADDTNPNSIFTRALIDSLSTPGLSLVQIAKQTQVEVDRLASAVDHEQTPAYSDNIKGDLVLLPAAAVAEPAFPPPPAGGGATADLAAWKAIESSTAPEDFATYLDRFGATAIFAEAARQRIAALTLPPAEETPLGRPKEDEELSLPSLGAGSAETSERKLSDTAEEEIVFAPGKLAATFERGELDQASGTGGVVRLFSAEGILLQTLWAEGYINDARFSRDGSRFGVASSDSAFVWDTASGRLIITLTTKNKSEQGFTSIDFSKDGRMIATGHRDGRVRLWDAETGSVLKTLDGPQLTGSLGFRSNFVAFDPSGEMLASAQSKSDDKIRVWNLRSGDVVRDFDLDYCAIACAVSGIRFYDGLVVVGIGAEQLIILDFATGRTVGVLEGRLILLARDGKDPAAMVADGNTVKVYNLLTDTLIQEVLSSDLASAVVDEELKLGARRSPEDGSWLLFRARQGAAAYR